MSDFGKDFGERLKSERNRLGKNQSQYAEFGGVSKLTQLKYEKGERVPSVEYLYGIYQQGANIEYLVTGERREDAPKPSGFFVDEGVIARAVIAAEVWLKATGEVTTAEEKAAAIVCLCDPKISPLLEVDEETGALKIAGFLGQLKGFLEQASSNVGKLKIKAGELKNFRFKK